MSELNLIITAKISNVKTMICISDIISSKNPVLVKKKTDLEAMFPESDRHIDVLPRTLLCSCLPTELPQFRLYSQQAVNYPD